MDISCVSWEGSFVFFMKKTVKADELIKAVVKKYEIEPDEAEYKVAEFLAKLIYGNVVEVV